MVICALPALWLTLVPGPWPPPPLAAEVPAEAATTAPSMPPLQLQLRLEFSPKLAEFDLPPAFDPQRVKILIDSTTPRPLSPASDGSITISVDFADHGEAAITGPFRLQHHPLRLSSEELCLDIPALEYDRLSGQLNLARTDNDWHFDGRLHLQGADGIIATSFYRDLNLSLPFRLEQGLLTMPDLQLDIREFNPGIALGPVKAQGHYRGPLKEPESGSVTITSFSAGILGGRLASEPFSFTPAQQDFAFVLGVEGLELAQLLAEHPVRGLTGTGLIDGRLPLRWQEGKLTLTDGLLNARPPGGVIRYDHQAATAMARRNPALKLVLDALSDFHYNALSAEATYHEDGTLLLALRLEGHNPQVERGRPIVLELNIEENLPALLAGLQLTNRISDTIRQRIEERYR